MTAAKSMRTSAKDFAYQVGRQARIEGLALHDANVRLAYKLGWTRREQYTDTLLDECERGWNAQDELMNPDDHYE